MRSHRSPLHLAPLTVPLTVVAFTLGGCSSDEDASPVLGNVSADGRCDPDVISVVDGPGEDMTPEPGYEYMGVHYGGNDGAPDASVEALAVSGGTSDGETSARFSSPGGTITWGFPDGRKADVDHIKVTATTDDGSAGTCTIDVA